MAPKLVDVFGEWPTKQVSLRHGYIPLHHSMELTHRELVSQKLNQDMNVGGWKLLHSLIEI